MAAATQIAEAGSRVAALDMAGGWTVHKLLHRMRDNGSNVTLHGLSAPSASFLAIVSLHLQRR